MTEQTDQRDCADDHGAWRDEIEDLKGDVEMWKSVAYSTRRAGAESVLRAVEAVSLDARGIVLANGAALEAARKAVAMIKTHPDYPLED